MKKYTYFFLIALTFFLSCDNKCKTSKKSLPVLELAKYVEHDIPDTFTWNSIQKKVTFIALETSKHSLLSEYCTPKFIDNKTILVVDNKFEKIFHFNNDGKILHVIYHKGNGPGEYVYLTHVSYNTSDSLIRVFDMGNRKLIFYNLKGEHIKSISTRGKFSGIIIFINDSHFVIQNDSGKYQISIFDEYYNQTQVKLPFDPICSRRSKSILPTTYSHSQNSDRKIFNPINNDTVYEFSDQRNDPLFVLKKGKFVFPESEIENVFKLEISDYSNYFMHFDIDVFSRYVLIKYSLKGKSFAEVWDLEKEAITSRTLLKNKVTKEAFADGLPYKLPSGDIIRIFPKYVTKNQLVFMIPAYDLLNEFKNLKEDDNPVLMIMNI